MNWLDSFKPYDPERNGDLLDYLKEHDGFSADNLFHGPKFFFVLRERGLIIPNSSTVRVDRSPAPDVSYLVNGDFLLESFSAGRQNMSVIGAEEGVYNPEGELKNKNWSISPLNLEGNSAQSRPA